MKKSYLSTSLRSSALQLALAAGLVLCGTTAMAAGQWKLMGSTDAGMELVESYPTQADCAKALGTALQRQSNRDFMCVDGNKAPAPVKK